MRCPICEKWEILPDDEFCSWCGHDLLGLTLSLDRSHLFFGDGFQTITLTIGYAGKNDAVEIKSIETNRQWITVKDEEVEGRRIETGSRIEVPLEVNALALAQPDGYHSGEITVVTDIATRRIQAEVNPTPKIDVSIGEATLLLTPSGQSRLAGHLEIRRGTVTVKELNVSVPWARVEVVGSAALPYMIDGRRDGRLDFQIVVDEDWLLRDIANNSRPTPAEYKGNLVVEYDELSPTREYPFYVNCMLPPELFISEGEQMEMDLFFGRPTEVVLNLQNGDQKDRGRADLEIRDITTNVGWLELSQTHKLPLKIESGRPAKITFAANANEAGEGSHVAELKFLTNVPGEDVENKVWVTVNVSEMPEFRRSIAIDFGTTNSCCAAMDASRSLVLINLDLALMDTALRAGQSPDVASSAIIYEDLLNDNRRKYEIGARPYEMRLDLHAAPSIVTQIKRRLGEDEKRPVTFFDHPLIRRFYKPKEIAADIIHRILERAESQLKGTINHCMIAHPSRFSMRQISELKDALISRGIEERNIRTIHEPVAAALDFVQDPEILAAYQEYNLMVFDFGGGTTDITLLHVTNRFDPGKKRPYTVISKLLGATGDRWLGGEDVTVMLMQLVLEKCEKLLRSRYPDARTFSIPFDATAFKNPRLKVAASENRINLENWGEAPKIAFSLVGDTHVGMVTRGQYPSEKEEALLKLIPAELKLAVLIDDQLKMSEPFQYEVAMPRLEALNETLRPRLEQVVEMMRLLATNNGIEAPDIILLCGGSSSMPIVEEVIADKFPEPATKIKRPEDPKKCVAKGACFGYSEYVPADVLVSLEKNGSLEATTSRLGIGVQGRRQARFEEIVPAGVPIPASGLRRVLDLPPLERKYRIPILENTGLVDDWIIDGKPNRNIRTLREFHIEQKLSEWEQDHNIRITDEALSHGQIEFEVTSNLTARLIARIPGIDEPIEFESVEVPGS